MAFNLIWSPTSCHDLRDLSTYIAEANTSAARRFVQSIFESVERLIDFPDSGRIVPEFNDPSIREIVRKPCRIVYRIQSEKEMVEIVRVWHAARGTPQI